GHQPREFGRDALGHVVHDGVPGKVDVVRKAAPEMGRLLGRGVAVADSVGVAPPVGVLAMTVLAEMTPLALAAGDVVLDEHQVTLLEPLAAGEFSARPLARGRRLSAPLLPTPPSPAPSC